MLLALSGRSHQVYTAVCLHYQGRIFHALNTNHVTFKPLTEAETAAYIRSREPLDKAGAYGIQGLGGIFVRELSGSFTGVMPARIRNLRTAAAGGLCRTAVCLKPDGVTAACRETADFAGKITKEAV